MNLGSIRPCLSVGLGFTVYMGVVFAQWVWPVPDSVWEKLATMGLVGFPSLNFMHIDHTVTIIGLKPGSI